MTTPTALPASKPTLGHEFEPKRFVLIGLGGIGAHVLRLTTQFLYSKRLRTPIVAVDGDTFEPKNRERMSFDRFGPKATVLVEELADQYGDVVRLLPVPHYLTPDNIENHVHSGDVVFCQPDNHKTRRLVEQRCATLDDVALFSGGNDGIEDGKTGTYGNVQAYLRSGGVDLTNAISRYHPEIAEPADKLPTELGCGAQIESAPQLLFTNASVAAAMLAAFYGWWLGSLGYEEVYLDILPGRMVPVHRHVRQPKS